MYGGGRRIYGSAGRNNLSDVAKRVWVILQTTTICTLFYTKLYFYNSYQNISDVENKS